MSPKMYGLLQQRRKKQDLVYVVVGAGPVGLWTAALLSLTGKQVVIFEKRTSYSRTQPVRLWPTFFAKLCLYPVLYTEKGRSLCQIFQAFGVKPFPIRKLETLLKKWLLREVPMSVTFHQAEIRSWTDLEKFNLQHDIVECVYACDGAHSAWRERYFQTERGEIFQTLLDMEHHAIDLRTYENKIKRVLLARLPGHIKKILRLSSTRTHILLRHDLDPKDIQLQDVDILKVRRITYGCYWSNEAVNEENKIILCGDSLCGVPFTRSLRNGLSCSLVATQWPTWVYQNYYSRLKIQEHMVSNVLNQWLFSYV